MRDLAGVVEKVAEIVPDLSGRLEANDHVTGAFARRGKHRHAGGYLAVTVDRFKQPQFVDQAEALFQLRLRFREIEISLPVFSPNVMTSVRKSRQKLAVL